MMPSWLLLKTFTLIFDSKETTIMNKAQLHLTNFLLLVEEAGSLTKLARACGYENSASLSQLKRRFGTTGRR